MKGETLDEETRTAFRILVIEDDEGVRTLLRDILVYGGYQVIEAPDGMVAMDYLKEGHFDMVLTDLGMPAMNGWEVAKWVKERSPRVPVGLITGWGRHLDEEEIKESGVDLIIAKPFQVKEILEAVRHCVTSP